MIRIDAAGITDTGHVRERNEDDLVIDDRLGLYAVADGIGGRKGGHLASSLAVDTVKSALTRSLSGTDASKRIDYDDTLSPEANLVNAAFHEANGIVNERAEESESRKGMGTTLSAIYFTDSTFIAVNVGDSPIYRIHNGDIDLISTPHLYYDPSPNGRKEPYLTRGIGIKAHVQADICEMQCFENDIFIICSDGLSSKVTSAEIHDIVIRENSESACRTLVTLANNRGGEDNITLIVLKVTQVNIRQSKVIRLISTVFDIFKSTSR